MHPPPYEAYKNQNLHSPMEVFYCAEFEYIVLLKKHLTNGFVSTIIIPTKHSNKKLLTKQGFKWKG